MNGVEVMKTIRCNDSTFWWMRCTYNGRRFTLHVDTLKAGAKDPLILEGEDLSSMLNFIRFLGGCYREFKKEFPYKEQA